MTLDPLPESSTDRVETTVERASEQVELRLPIRMDVLRRILVGGVVFMAGVGLGAEIAQYHEEISSLFDYDGVLYFGWVIPAGIFVTLFGVSYVRFFLHLPRSIGVRIAIAGGVYVFGALLMELPLGYWTDNWGSHGLGYGLIDLVEESLEIAGVSLFLHTLLQHLATVGQPEPAGPVGPVGPVGPAAMEPAPS
jgi:hypothetical protein